MLKALGASTVLAALLLMGAGPAPPPPAGGPVAEAPATQPGGPAAKPAEKPAGEDANFKFIPQSIQINSSINFDQRGRIQNQNGSVNLGFRIDYAGKATLIGIRNLQITRAETDAGEVLRSAGGMGDVRVHDWMLRQNQPQFQNQFQNPMTLNMAFIGPNHSARRLTAIAGTFEAVFAKGPLQEAEIKPVGDILGKTIRFKGNATPDAWITFTRPQDNQMQVRYVNNMRSMLYEIDFLDENGRTIDANGWGANEENGMETRQLNCNVPDKGRIVVRMYPDLDTQVVHFRVVDVPLSQPDRGVQPSDVVIELHPAGQGTNDDVKLHKIEAVIVN